MTNKTVKEFVDVLREKHQPKGTLPLSKLTLRNHGYVEHELVSAAIDQLERMMLLSPSLVEEASPLQKLGILLLLESER